MADAPFTLPEGDPVSLPAPTVGRERPWWGLGDVWLGVPFIVIIAIAGTVLGLPFVDFGEFREWLSSGEGEMPLALLVASLLAQQFGQGGWPILVSMWKGRGPVADWRLNIKLVDPLIGLGAAAIAVGGAGVVSAIMATLVDLGDETADNTQFLRDAEGSPWLYVLVFSVVIGAPLAEELFFRGLILRAFEKRAGPVVAVIGSTVLFTLPHWTGAGLAPTVVLLSAIAVVGVVLATVTVKVGRLWPAIFAHMAFNSIGAAEAVGLFERAAV
ncbi:MAG: CPBP family intramembrane metalloprotease [Actinomycetia bacterium]|nr:CPBP family intramembrane metalloprotease [Actinomycetes bacterium]